MASGFTPRTGPRRNIAARSSVRAQFSRNGRRGFRPQRYVGLIVLGIFMAVAAVLQSPSVAALVPSGLSGLPPGSAADTRFSIRFPLCGARRHTCVVDGDTFWLRGQKIRIADFNAPEVSSPACAAEARLGARATKRLQSLLNAGPFELRSAGRDEDRYGRKLRTVHRSGRSLGDQMIQEGLGHVWHGYKENWCA